MLYNKTDLVNTNTLNCGNVDDGNFRPEQLEASSRDVGDCVLQYIEVGNSVYDAFNDVQNTIDYVEALFAQSFVIYANDGVEMAISEINVNTVPDPYVGPTSANYRSQFQNAFNGFNGDLAHLIELDNVGGIAAGFSGLCNADPDQSMCFSGLSGLNFNNIPTYSFNIYLITHEAGHLMGSRHTHACVWNGNNTAIDGCSGFTEGACALPPSANPGTIMSYCNPNVSFAEGFHPQPTVVINNSVINANCLAPCNACDLTIASVMVVNETCDNTADGSITVTGNTSNGPITYTLSGAANASNNTGVFTGLSIGSYTVTLTDMEPNCSVDTMINIGLGCAMITVINPIYSLPAH